MKMSKRGIVGMRIKTKINIEHSLKRKRKQKKEKL